MDSLGKERGRRRRRFVRIMLLVVVLLAAAAVGWYSVAVEGKPLTWSRFIKLTAVALVAVGMMWWTMIAQEKFQKNMEEKDRRAALHRERERSGPDSD